MYITSITGDLRLPWAIKAQFSTRPNWASDVMVFLSVYFFLTNAQCRWFQKALAMQNALLSEQSEEASIIATENIFDFYVDSGASYLNSR